MTTSTDSSPWVVATIDGRSVAIPALDVLEMLPMPPVTFMPGLPPNLRGVLNIRGGVMPLIDLRRLFGMPTSGQARDQLLEVLAGRRKDHEDWLAELDACVREGRPFTKATDPTQCAFGKWHAAFETSHPQLRMLLDEFVEPHTAIHALAHRALSAAEADGKEAGLKVVDHGRKTVYRRMIDLFDRANGAVSQAFTEIAIVVNSGDRPFAFSVDAIDALHKIDVAGGSDLLGMSPEDVARHGVRGVGHSKTDKRVVLLLDARVLADLSGGAKAA